MLKNITFYQFSASNIYYGELQHEVVVWKYRESYVPFLLMILNFLQYIQTLIALIFVYIRIPRRDSPSDDQSSIYQGQKRFVIKMTTDRHEQVAYGALDDIER